MTMIHCSTYGLRIYYKVSALWLCHSNPSTPTTISLLFFSSSFFCVYTCGAGRKVLHTLVVLSCRSTDASISCRPPPPRASLRAPVPGQKGECDDMIVLVTKQQKKGALHKRKAPLFVIMHDVHYIEYS